MTCLDRSTIFVFDSLMTFLGVYGEDENLFDIAVTVSENVNLSQLFNISYILLLQFRFLTESCHFGCDVAFFVLGLFESNNEFFYFLVQ